jgi:energy-coupling factor transport system ATP-binding protein
MNSKTIKPGITEPDILIEPGSFVLVCGLTESGKGRFMQSLAPVDARVKDEDRSPFFEDMASLLSVAELTDRDVATLSGGQRQRLMLAHSLAAQMPTLVLDEPTAHLDPATAWLLLGFLIRLNREQGVTVVISDRHLEELLSVCNRVLFFLKDRVVFDGNAQDFIVKASGNAAAFTTALPANVTVPLIRHMKATTEQGHDAMAGTYLIAKYPLTIQEARERLAKWPEVKRLQEAKEQADALDSASGADHFAVAVEEEEQQQDAGSTWFLNTAGLSLSGGRIVALMGDNASGKSRMLDAVNLHADAEGLPLKRLTQKLRGGEEQLIALKRILDEAEAIVGAHADSPVPGVLLLDEPTAGIDEATTQKQARRITALKKAGWAVLIATQNMDFASLLADDCLTLAAGKVTDPLSPRDFFDNALLYTTTVNRVTRGYFDRCVTIADVARYL